MVDVSGDDLWSSYLAAFPEGSNPIYRERTEHDCSCCRNFVKNFGNVVAINEGRITSIWSDYGSLDHPYDVVAEKLDLIVRSAKVVDVYRSKWRTFGAEETRELLPDQSVKRWNHFSGTVSPRHFSADADSDRGKFRSTVQVFRRGLNELKAEALDTVIELIDQGSLYRGEEHLSAIREFRRVQTKFLQLSDEEQEIFAWANANSPAARFRNTVMGTLVQDLSEGKELEQAVRSFETKVAPTNYKRTSALITPRMVKDAMKTINELYLEPALERRFAKLSDITVNNVLWADASARESMMRSPLENALMESAVSKVPKNLRATDIGIKEFVNDVLPLTTGLDLHVRSSHLPNFVSLTGPVFAGNFPGLFKWNNGFAWSYDGNIADSIKERVKAAGGNVTNAAMRVSLAWSNMDDLDIHVYEPSGSHIYYANRDGKLDVDMNAIRGTTRQPVENVSWTQRDLKDGAYKVHVHQFCQRETVDVGFSIEIENQGKIYNLSYAPTVKSSVLVCQINVKDGKIWSIQPAANIMGGAFSQKKWGIDTETFVRVETVLLSPNFWDGQKIGNKHWFFMLEGCVNPDPTRGIYNEFLRSDLEKHRKVFEILGNKTMCESTAEQLSGLGFSSTRDNAVTVRAIGPNLRENLNITF